MCCEGRIEPPWPHCLFGFFTLRWSSSSSRLFSSRFLSAAPRFCLLHPASTCSAFFRSIFIQLEICCTIKRASRRFLGCDFQFSPVRFRPCLTMPGHMLLLLPPRLPVSTPPPAICTSFSSSSSSCFSILCHEKFHWNWFLLWSSF